MGAGNGKDGRSRDDRYLATYIRAHSVADSTYQQYERALNKWHVWASRRGISIWLADYPLAVQVQHISEFVLHGFRFGYGSGGPIRSETIMTVLHGIRHFFAAAGYEFPITHPHIRMLLKAALTPCEPASLQFPWSSWKPIFAASTEIVAISNGKFTWFAVRAQDIVVVDRVGQPTLNPSQAQSVCMSLIASKTNQNGVPMTRMLSRSGHSFLCPVFGALILHQSRKNLLANIPAAVFLARGGTPSCVSTSDVSDIIKHAAAEVGHDPRVFSSHSLHSGGATHMYRSGTDALTIQFHGRWVSDAFKTYTRLCKESVATLSSSMVTGQRGDSTLH
ncbi:LOW QUALITY PROTEIN: hypothetical protein PHPALM_30437 [Phytophthora palmivora]|uniref:Tyr recombinase domain-containing protein n=1 Tax=Phytophthora palmivora TaxID=4796 RepID=A0A2P4X557_9STRA|nr:LOW QUALITY PROTEIN: hypothetical protein PHPALM_30437 [Phytophthora palmivora]